MPLELPRTGPARRERVLQAIGQVPRAPGVYLFLDRRGEVLYIGKSVCLRDRVRSYFTGRAATVKLRRLRHEVAAVDWCVTPAEIQALLLESRWIKRHQPRYNVLLREFSARPYLRLDVGDPFPRLEVTRHPAADGARYFGPFAGSETLTLLADVLADVAGLRTCEPPGPSLPGKPPCYRRDLGYCLAPCVAPDRAAYGMAVERVIAAIRGRDATLLAAVGERMRRAADRLEFERAAALRDGLRQLRAGAGREVPLASALAPKAFYCACAGMEPGHVALLALAGGRLAAYVEATPADLADPRCRADFVAELASIRATPPEPSGLPEEVLDEVQIVSAWLRQRPRYGAPLEASLRRGAEARARTLDRWLAHLATRLAAPRAA